MKRIIISESQLKRLIENEFNYGLEYYEQNFSKFENQVKSYHSQVVKFYNFINDLSLGQVMNNLGEHKKVLEQHKSLKEKISQLHDKIFDITELIQKTLELEDENVWYYSNPLYKKYDDITGKIDNLNMDFDDMLEVYDFLVQSANNQIKYQKNFQQEYGFNTLSIEPSED